ncbi:MAG: hypothetical protein V4819_25965 [Verrucomicrobiota bacterium]
MKQELERYLNDHLAGASGALLLIQHLIDTMEESEARDFLADLKVSVQADRELLQQLLTDAGMEPSTVLKVAGRITARFGLMKLMWEGLEPGMLGRFEAFEMLALGVQGKTLLWRALREIASCYREWGTHDFARLEQKAIEQRDGIERWRIEAARDSLSR